MSLLHELAAHFEMGWVDIERFIRTAPARYKVYEIDKRNGDKRTIAQPTSTLKMFQRYVLDEKLMAFPVHDCAAAYIKGRGIVDNANVHKPSNFLLKLDFEKFFPSITVGDWRKFIKISNEDYIDIADKYYYERILFWGDGGFSPRVLSIGAPTSPHMSNIIMYKFDTIVHGYAQANGLKYTRYADDITVSGPSAGGLIAAEVFIEKLIDRTRSPRLKLNREKRGLYGRGQRRMVTGLVITPTHEVSIGRERKRQISAMLHHAKLGQLDIVQLGNLKGLLGFTAAAEPEFLGRMRAKYGNEVVDRVMKLELPRRGES